MRRAVLAGFAVLACVVLSVAPVSAQDIAELESRVTTFTLDNGLQFIVYEQHDAPVFSYVSIAKVGSVNEVPGITGLAHMFEHMAFKGTTEIGTKGFAKEAKAIEDIDTAYAALWQGKLGGVSEEEMAELEAGLAAAQEAADEHVETNEFGAIVEQAGGTGLNASTQPDVTTYFYNLPSNKLELWAYLESQRYTDPVLREFYKERDVVMEERRMRTESSPIGRLIEEFSAAAFLGHPYGQPTVGHMSDLQSFTRQDAEDFYNKYYVPGNVVFALSGDLDPAEVERLARKYFSQWKAGPVPEPVRTVEPPQRGERRVELVDPGQPFLALGYHKPAATDADDPVFDVLSQILANGRSSRLHQRLVKDEKKAVAVGAFTAFPGMLYPGLMINFAVPAKDVTAHEIELVLLEEIERLKNEPVPAAELEGAKTRLKADWIREVRSNTGMGLNLLRAQVILGDWRQGFTFAANVDAVTADDIQRVARKYFNETNRTVGLIRTEDEEVADAS